MTNISSMDDIESLFKETIAELMEDDPEAEPDKELGYSKYDYKNKDTDNSRNDTVARRYVPVSGMYLFRYRGTGKGKFEPQVLKKSQIGISQDIEEKILSMYAKGTTTGDIE